MSQYQAINANLTKVFSKTANRINIWFDITLQNVNFAVQIRI
jgi:hypothetical protein